MKAPITALLGLLTAGCSPAADGPKSATHPQTILVIRHAEKPAADADPDLSPEGKKRADALPDLFARSASRPDPFPTPDFIFATAASKHSNRPVETVTPLAKKLNLAINSTFADDDYPRLVKELYSNPKYAGKTVLICWHHGTIPELATALGTTDVPKKWDGHVFNRVWVVTYDEAGKPKALVQRPQALMPGDEKE